MAETSLTLLCRLQKSEDSETWNQMVAMYAPLLSHWLMRYGVQSNDVDDLVQDVLMVVLKSMKTFDHNGRPGAFRSWLRSIMVNRLRDFWRSRGRRPRVGCDSDLENQLRVLEDPESSMSQLWNQQHDQHVLRKLLELAKPQFAPETWQAFLRTAIDGVKADAVALELGISINAVFIAKSRVLSSLRREAVGLVDSSIQIPKNR